jgi:hypothetical protein
MQGVVFSGHAFHPRFNRGLRMRACTFYALCALIVLFSLSAPLGFAHAQSAETPPQTEQKTSTPPIDILPAKTAQTRGIMYNTDEITHPELRMTSDKSELIHLDGNAASIIIGNPRHLSVTAESASLLVLSSRAPGATVFTVLDAKGSILMQRHVIVDAPKERYMRVRKSCAGSDDNNCQTTNIYYCPGACHKILVDDGEQSQTQGGSGVGNTAQSSGTSEPAPEENPNATEEPTQ